METNVIYQASLIAFAICSLVVLFLSITTFIKLTAPIPEEPTTQIREQQLKNAINIIFPGELVD